MCIQTPHHHLQQTASSLIRDLCFPAAAHYLSFTTKRVHQMESTFFCPGCLFIFAFKVQLHHKIGAMTHISNNLAVRLSIGALQRERRILSLGAFSDAHQSTSKLANRLTCFYGNSRHGREMGLF